MHKGAFRTSAIGQMSVFIQYLFDTPNIGWIENILLI